MRVSARTRRPAQAVSPPRESVDEREVAKFAAYGPRPRSLVARWLATTPPRTLARLAAAAFLLKVVVSYFLYSFARSRCFLIEWGATTELTEVPRVRDQAQLDAHIARHEPALLDGALASWPAVAPGPRRWTPARLASLLGEREVELFFRDPSSSAASSGADWKRSRTFGATLAEYVALLARYEALGGEGGGAAAPAAGTNRSAAAGGAPRAAAPYLREDEALFAKHEATLLPDVGGLPFRPHLGPAGRGAAPGLPSQTAHFSETAFWIRPRGAWTGVHWDAVSARRELLTRGGGHF